MGVDSFAKLEDRVNKLLNLVAELRAEIARLNAKIDEKDRRIEELERERHETASMLGALRSACEDRERKMHAAADKLEQVVNRLESAE